MSSPVTIAHSTSSSSLSASPRQSGLYVPVHKRTGSSPSTSRSPSPQPLSEVSSSWRTHTPSKSPSAAFRNKHRKTPSNASQRKLFLSCAVVFVLTFPSRFHRAHPYTQSINDTPEHYAPKHILYFNTSRTLIILCTVVAREDGILDWIAFLHGAVRGKQQVCGIEASPY